MLSNLFASHFAILFVSCSPAPPPTDAGGGSDAFASLRLPVAVRIETRTFNNGLTGDPFDRKVAEIRPDGVVGRQERYRGSLGFVLSETFFEDIEQTLRYEPGPNRATRSDLFPKSRISSFEIFVSPLGFIRQSRFLAAEATRADKDGLIIITTPPPQAGRPTIEITIDPVTSTVPRVRALQANQDMTFEYSDYADCGEGTVHPRKVTVYFPNNPKPQIILIDSVSTLTSLAPLTPPKLPKGAIIHDTVKGVFLDESGLPLANAPSMPQNPGNASWLTLLWKRYGSAATIGIGVLIVAIAAILKRRGKTGVT